MLEQYHPAENFPGAVVNANPLAVLELEVEVRGEADSGVNGAGRREMAGSGQHVPTGNRFELYSLQGDRESLACVPLVSFVVETLHAAHAHFESARQHYQRIAQPL